MSRSYRKTPIFGDTTCRSEKQEKKQWHKALRAKERVAQALLSQENLDSHIPLHENQIGNVWLMGKDGHSYWSKSSYEDSAQTWANSQGKTPREREALRNRRLRKWMGK